MPRFTPRSSLGRGFLGSCALEFVDVGIGPKIAFENGQKAMEWLVETFVVAIEKTTTREEHTLMILISKQVERRLVAVVSFQRPKHLTYINVHIVVVFFSSLAWRRARKKVEKIQ